MQFHELEQMVTNWSGKDVRWGHVEEVAVPWLNHIGARGEWAMVANDAIERIVRQSVARKGAVVFMVKDESLNIPWRESVLSATDMARLMVKKYQPIKSGDWLSQDRHTKTGQAIRVMIQSVCGVLFVALGLHDHLVGEPVGIAAVSIPDGQHRHNALRSHHNRGSISKWRTA